MQPADFTTKSHDSRTVKSWRFESSPKMGFPFPDFAVNTA